MSRNIQRDIINYLMSSGQYRLDELVKGNSGKSVWALRRSDRFDEIIVFADYREYSYVKNFLHNHINQNYVGQKGVSIEYILFLSDDKQEFNLDSTIYSEGYIVNSSVVVVDENKLQIVYTDGISFCVNAVNAILSSKRKSIESRGFWKMPVTYTLILINVIMFFISAMLSGGLISINSEVLLLMGAKYNLFIKSGQYYRLITAMFLHGGIVHLALNMYSLHVIGSLIERIYGSRRFIVIYFISGIFGSLFSFAFSNGLSVGASGAIFGLLGTALIYGIKMKNRIGKGFLNNIFQVIVINLILGFSISNIDNAGHIGGLIGGILITLFFEMKNGWK